MIEREKYNWLRLTTLLFTTIDMLLDYIEFFEKEKVNEDLIKPLYSFIQILEFDIEETTKKAIEDLEKYKNEK